MKLSNEDFAKLAVEEQKNLFQSGKTLSYDFRKRQLIRLKTAIKSYEKPLIHALEKDFHKPAFESYVTEIGQAYEEINFALKHLKRWMKPERRHTPITQFPSRSYVYPEPRGTVFVIAPWNYPFNLIILPLIGAIAAGNTVILKSASEVPLSSGVICEMIRTTFEPNYVLALTGRASLTQAFLHEPLDYVFFTGSTRVGKIIMQTAAENLIPVTLELGGKSPAIVHELHNPKITAQRIAWGKFINAGQTCVAPDYILVKEELKEPLIKALIDVLHEFYGQMTPDHKDYAHIINEKHFNRLKGYLGEGTIRFGGDTDEEALYIAPTLMDQISEEAKVMEDEIFGPILPILTYQTIEEAIQIVCEQPEPLALYLFSENQVIIDRIISRVPFGGGAINDTVSHLGTSYLAFGGRGRSGMGSYHGVKSFETFSHHKSILRKHRRYGISLAYPPYTKEKHKILRTLEKHRLLKKFIK
jgi:aldehyde dehydrogenase (NAD+)